MFNVTRQQTTPASLAQKTWRGADVALALRTDFLDKCYLCETKDPLSFNVEHFDAHQGSEEKKYDWENLFFACARCNNFKGASVSVVDCTDPDIDVCRLIKHGLPSSPNAQISIEAKSTTPLIVETTNLLNRIYNDASTGNRLVAGSYLRKQIFKKCYQLLTHINTLIDDDATNREKDYSQEKIAHYLNKNQEFSAFLRWIVLDDPVLKEQFEHHID